MSSGDALNASSMDLMEASQQPREEDNGGRRTAAAAAGGDSEELLGNTASLLGSSAAPHSSAANGEEEEEEELSAAEVIDRMSRAWINEKFSPVLLPHQTQVVECLLDQIRQMEASLKEVGASDFRVPLHRLELARVRFLVASYLRIRLRKIERFVHTLGQEESEELLSKEEQAFAANYKSALETHFRTLALQHLPGEFGSMPGPRTDPPPPSARLAAAATVFAAVPPGAPAVNGLFVSDDSGLGKEEEIDLEPGSQHLIKFKDVESLVRDGSMHLI